MATAPIASHEITSEASGTTAKPIAANTSPTAQDALNQNVLFVKEQVGMFKASSNFDIFDPETGVQLLQCREPHLGPITRLFRFSKYKHMTPFDVHVTTPGGEPLVRVSRDISLLVATVRVNDEHGQFIGSFKQKVFSIARFIVMDENDQPVCELKGKWTGWDFKFHANGVQLARVTKKWSGIGKELFTSADNYVLEIDEAVPASSKIRKLILAAVMTIDLVLKE